MKFDRIDPAAALTPLPGDAAEMRRFLREKLSAKGSMRFGGRGYTITMKNLSEQGCQFWLPRREGLPKGASITLYIDKLGPFPATVRWGREGWVGVEFDLPVYSPVLQHIREHIHRAE